MHAVARWDEAKRKALFREAAAGMRVHEAIIEKDFWVCWILDYLFHESPWKESLAFKGGTSLSKAYGLIERFSEDIDLILDWKLLGYTDEDPWKDRTPTQQMRFGQAANEKTEKYLAAEMAPHLRSAAVERMGDAVKVTVEGQNILFEYPRAYSLEAILPQVRLEIGPVAAWVPNEEREIRPYAAERFPALFTHPSTSIRTITAERSFWEKATILHQEAHRSLDKPLPPRYSRHYYDLYRLCRSPVKDKACGDLELLADVVRFKMRFYQCNWAGYEVAKPGSLRFSPPENRLSELKKDYQAMQSMLFGTIPKFEAILSELAGLEAEMNSRGTR